MAVSSISDMVKSSKSSPQEEIDRLQSTIASLEQQITSLALDNRTLLLRETKRFKNSATDFQKLFLAIRSLQTVAARVKAEVSEPFARLSSKTVQLTRLYKTIDLLRQTTAQIKLVDRIRSEMQSENMDLLDLSKVARLLSEAALLRQEVDLSGIRVCDENDRYLEGAKVRVHDKLVYLLGAGVESRNQVDIAGALQALHNLQELAPALDMLVQNMAQRVKKIFVNALDMKKISAISGIGASAFSQASSQANQKVLWEQIVKATEEFKEVVICMWHLQKVLIRKKDPLSHKKFIDLIDSSEKPFDRFWRVSLGNVKEAFDTIMDSRSSVVKDTLLGQYPKLARIFENTIVSVIKETMDGRTATIGDEKMDAFYNAVASVESEYLLSVQSKFEGLAMAAFPGGNRNLTSQVDLQSLTARFHEEVKVVQHGGERITALLAAVLGTVLLTIASQARDMGADAGLLSATGPCSISQARNLGLAKALEDIIKNIIIIQGKLSKKAAKALEGPIDIMRQTTHDLLQPIFKGKREQFENIIKKVHSLNFGAEEGSEATITDASSYITELHSGLHEFRQDMLSKCSVSMGSTGVSSVSQIMTHTLCVDLIKCWIHHVALIRPLTTPGRLQIAKDAAEFESSLEQHLLSAHKSGKGSITSAIVSLKSFRRLLFVENVSSIEPNSSIMQSLSKVVILHHLFSRCPPYIESPYSKNKLTPAQYYVWVEDHSDEEVMKLIKTTLEAGLSKHPEDDVTSFMTALLK